MHDETCPHCHGLGFIGYDVELSDPRFGKAYLCPTIYATTWDEEMGIARHEAARLNWHNFNSSTAKKNYYWLITTYKSVQKP